MMAAKVGAGFTAEIGSMNTTDQIDALKLMGVSPVHYLAVPRFVGCMSMQVCMSIIGLFCCIAAGYLASLPEFNLQSYISIMNSYVGWPDFINLILKAVGLGWVVPVVSCHYGFRCRGGARGVGDATTRAVVTAILIIIVIDFTITAIADKLVVAAMSFL
jgi:phospholipid/cholesterol/gamma-HCH transport system permease protein